jgi:Rrf2 family protein
MRITTRGRYGLRIMLELALRDGDGTGPVQAATVAQSQDLPMKYVQALAGSLKSAGLLRAVRGHAGGLLLARSPGAITALDVVRALEGPVALLDCALDPSACRHAERCVARDLWCELGEAMEQVLGRHTLAELAERQRTWPESGYAI